MLIATLVNSIAIKPIFFSVVFYYIFQAHEGEKRKRGLMDGWRRGSVRSETMRTGHAHSYELRVVAAGSPAAAAVAAALRLGLRSRLTKNFLYLCVYVCVSVLRIRTSHLAAFFKKK